MNLLRKYAILVSTILLCGMLSLFFTNLSELFDEVEDNYKKSYAINLSPKTEKGKLSDILLVNGYVKDKKEADLIADTLTARLKRMRYTNLYNLQKRAYGKIPASLADSLKIMADAVSDSYKNLGLSDTLPSVNSIGTKFDLHSGDGTITVKVFSKDSSDCSGVPVRLTEYYLDDYGKPHSDIVGFAKTDSSGVALFGGLDRERGYSVLPVRKGMEYGSSQGIPKGEFDKYVLFNHFIEKHYLFDFEQIEHRVQMIGNLTLKQIKNDGTITVRTPEEFKSEVIKWFGLVLMAWWLFVLFLIWRKRNFDPILISTAMFLSGLCVIVMYSIQNPLTEELRGAEMAKGVLMGIGVAFLLQFVDFVGLYQGRYKFDFDIPRALVVNPFKTQVRWSASTLLSSTLWYKKIFALIIVVLTFMADIPVWFILPFKQKLKWVTPWLVDKNEKLYKKIFALLAVIICAPLYILDILQITKICKLLQKSPKGAGWLFLALLLTLLLWSPLGRTVGGMRVNLSLFGLLFQPSEIAKYLILLFMAAFFTQNADTIIAYSQPGRTRIVGKIRTLGWVIGGLVLLILLYATLGDMGPALVIGLTFVFLYSLVKSKVNLDNLSEDDKWKRIFTCDFAMLIYGVLSFAGFVLVGYLWNNALALALLWFAAWIVFGFIRNKQFFETAFIINMLVFAFMFGGQIMGEIPVLRDTDTAERFEQRTRMCVNTWGKLDIEYDQNHEPVSNTQVANGLWAIATGGMFGQGLGNGNPNLIPAFHTDMILSSIGEQLGWIGLLLVVIAFAVLLRRMIVAGYKAGHPFAFYLCVGFAIVTAVQFFIIALGSAGMIPLTGITVPFLSYGRVSMILNLTAFGMVLSISKDISAARQVTAVQEQVRKRSVGDYNYPISIVTWSYLIIALFTLYVWQYYALWARNKTLVHIAYVKSYDGMPLIEYNPRIALVTKEMWAGNIYDRNGKLLATSDKDKLFECYGKSDTSIRKIAEAKTRRYYPLGEQLFFMVGNMNNGLFGNSVERPGAEIGYMAEWRHLSYLRDFDNLHDKNGNPTATVTLRGEVKSNLRYLKDQKPDTVEVAGVVLRDYYELTDYLKSGVRGKALKKHNEKMKNGDCDLTLAIDAGLQMELQNKLKKYVEEDNVRYKGGKRTPLAANGRLRISVVVLDAQNGDLLASANYPLPDYKTMRDKGGKAYNDNNQPADWHAYTDRDLGLTYPSMPGSTAKIMSAMAGMNKLGTAMPSYDIQLYEVIDYGDNGPAEPPMYGRQHEEVDLKNALVVSSNCYFINLVNNEDLYYDLEKIYAQAGIRVGYKSTYRGLYYPDTLTTKPIHQVVDDMRDKALASWEKYQTEKAEGKYVNGKDKKRLRKKEWMWAWGQHSIDATPLAMARVVSAVANDGYMPETRYLLSSERPKTHSVISKDYAKILKECMKAQYDYNSNVKSHLKKRDNVGGKTGTPHRDYTRINRKTAGNVRDGWYVFYMDNKQVGKSAPKLAVAVRMERIGLSGGSSTDAMWLSNEVIKVLESHFYEYKR